MHERHSAASASASEPLPTADGPPPLLGPLLASLTSNATLAPRTLKSLC